MPSNLELERNKGRAEAGLRALETNGDYQGNEDSDNVTDLLTNLMHYCQQEDIDFKARLWMAEIHFQEEQP